MHLLTYHDVNGAAYNAALDGYTLPDTRAMAVAVASIQSNAFSAPIHSTVPGSFLRRDQNTAITQPYRGAEHWQTSIDSQVWIEIPEAQLPLALTEFLGELSI